MKQMYSLIHISAKQVSLNNGSWEQHAFIIKPTTLGQILQPNLLFMELH